MEEYEFDYEDEMETMREMESGDDPPMAKGKRSLNFSAQNTEGHDSTKLSMNSAEQEKLKKRFDLDDSFTQVAPLDNSLLEDKENEVDTTRKRVHSDDNAVNTKKRCTDVDVLSDPIERVKAMRDLHKTREVVQGLPDHIVPSTNADRPRVLRRIPDHAFMSVTSLEGKRLYLGMKSNDNIKNEAAKVGTGSRSMQLLSMPLRNLQMEADELSARRLALSSEAEMQDAGNEAARNQQPVEARSLWVERYSPKNYMDLLSDESTNRSLLRWMKQWDYVVFGKEKDRDAKPKENAKQHKDGPKPPWVIAAEALTELDEHNRPLHKVAFLHGPPGLGKTTLAHIVARHAGYNVVEMNASDDRSAEIFEQKIEAATQMRSVLESDPKPNCLIIDEIDGAPTPAINVLLSVIKGDKKGKKKRQNQGILRRPIICICNDLYVPSLRNLRPLAFVVQFPITLASKLANRLFQVSKHESLKTDLSTLMLLCEKTANDIRSCLNTLQFVSRTSQELSIKSVNSACVGQKDVQKSLMSVWQSVFQLPKQNKKVYINPYDRDSDPAKNQVDLMAATTVQRSRFDEMLHTAQAAGEHEKVLQGLYDNFLEAKTKDPSMFGVVQAYEWLTYVDQLNQVIGHSQDYTMWSHLPFLPVSFHFLFASNSPNKLNYPKTSFEFHSKHTQTEHLLSALFDDVSVSVRKSLNVNVLVLDLLPLLIHVIQPPLRPVNIQLYSAAEKKCMAQLIETMLAFNLTYVQEVTPDGQSNFNLHPNLDDVALFPGLKRSQKQFSHAAKQLIAREVDMERMRRAEGPSLLRAAVPTPSKPKSSSSGPIHEPSHKRQKLQPKAISEHKVQALDFFGRPIIKKTTEETTAKSVAKDNNVIGGDVWFRFKEGYTNAVRRTVRISDLL